MTKSADSVNRAQHSVDNDPCFHTCVHPMLICLLSANQKVQNGGVHGSIICTVREKSPCYHLCCANKGAHWGIHSAAHRVGEESLRSQGSQQGHASVHSIQWASHSDDHKPDESHCAHSCSPKWAPMEVSTVPCTGQAKDPCNNSAGQ